MSSIWVLRGAAFVLLFCGYILAHRHLRRLRSASAEKSHKLTSLRGQFDDIIMAQFSKWGLSQAESDIALLSLRGLRIGDIAKMRGVREGTIKSQFSSIFRKSAIGTRAEFLAYFMDEFLDFSTTSGALDSSMSRRRDKPVTTPLQEPSIE